MSMFSSIDTSGSGLTAQRKRMDTISENIANMNTTRTQDGGPYKRKDVQFREYIRKTMTENGEIERREGVKAKVSEEKKPPRLVYNPSHPDANEQGYVAMPDMDIATEMVNMISASRGYEANVTALNAGKSMMIKALDIGKR